MIYTDAASGQTICTCDRCSVIEVTQVANGVIPSDWLSGQFILDISLSEQRHYPVCFCADCKLVMELSTTIQISARVEQPPPIQLPDE